MWPDEGVWRTSGLFTAHCETKQHSFWSTEIHWTCDSPFSYHGQCWISSFVSAHILLPCCSRKYCCHLSDHVRCMWEISICSFKGIWLIYTCFLFMLLFTVEFEWKFYWWWRWLTIPASSFRREWKWSEHWGLQIKTPLILLFNV